MKILCYKSDHSTFQIGFRELISYRVSVISDLFTQILILRYGVSKAGKLMNGVPTSGHFFQPIIGR